MPSKPLKAIKPMFASASSWKIVRGDKVQVMAGKDKGKQGEVLKVIRDQRFPRVFVSGVNMVSIRLTLLLQHCTSLHLCYCYCCCYCFQGSASYPFE
jgi:hypothetical protein